MENNIKQTVETQEVQNTEKSTSTDKDTKVSVAEFNMWEKKYDTLKKQYEKAVDQISNLEKIKNTLGENLKNRELAHKDLEGKFIQAQTSLRHNHIKELFKKEGGDESKMKHVLTLLGNKSAQLEDKDLINEFKVLKTELSSLFVQKAEPLPTTNYNGDMTQKTPNVPNIPNVANLNQPVNEYIRQATRRVDPQTGIIIDDDSSNK